MAAKFQTISLKPMSGALNTRARPSDLSPGEFRWKLSLRMNESGRLARRDGYQRFGLNQSSDFFNQDHHWRQRTRLPVTMLFESTSSDGVRRLFDATDKEVSVLDSGGNQWTDLATGMGGADGARWHAAELQDVVIFTNNVDTVRSHTLGSAEFDDIPELAQINVTKARVVVQFSGFILLMNVVQDGTRRSSRVMWSDINGPTHFKPGNQYGGIDSLANFQDLDYGDDIIAAATLGGNLMIYTRRSIWRCFVQTSSTDPTAVFAFQKVYSEPENQKGCIVYPNTLVNLGDVHVYASRDDFYVYSPYFSKPKNLDEWEWMHNATGIVFDPLQWPTYALDANYCEAPCAKFVPVRNEIWFSWPSSGANGVNNHTLVFNTVHRTADYVDDGFTAFVNNRQTPDGAACNESQAFIGASARDLGLKEIGNAVFKRELFVVGDSLSDDVPEPTYYDEGYDSLITGMLPLGYPDKDKVCDTLSLEHDTVAQDEPCLIQLRIGNSYNVADPVDADGTCSVQWRKMKDLLLKCPGVKKMSALVAKNLRPGLDTSWNFYAVGRCLYFELKITGKQGPAVGGDAAFSKIDVRAMALEGTV